MLSDDKLREKKLTYLGLQSVNLGDFSYGQIQNSVRLGSLLCRYREDRTPHLRAAIDNEIRELEALSGMYTRNLQCLKEEYEELHNAD